MSALIPFTIGETETDFILEVEYRITHRGYPATYDDPGEGPEWEIVSVTLLRDWTKSELEEAVERRNKQYGIPIWMQELLDEDGWLNEKVGGWIANHDEDNDDPPEPDYRDRHGSCDD
jgi:hypothetical protein